MANQSVQRRVIRVAERAMARAPRRRAIGRRVPRDRRPVRSRLGHPEPSRRDHDDRPRDRGQREGVGHLDQAQRRDGVCARRERGRDDDPAADALQRPPAQRGEEHREGELSRAEEARAESRVAASSSVLDPRPGSARRARGRPARHAASPRARRLRRRGGRECRDPEVLARASGHGDQDDEPEEVGDPLGEHDRRAPRERCAVDLPEEPRLQRLSDLPGRHGQAQACKVDPDLGNRRLERRRFR